MVGPRVCGYLGAMKSTEMKWYHHLLYPRVLLTIVLTVATYIFFAAFGLYLLLAK